MRPRRPAQMNNGAPGFIAAANLAKNAGVSLEQASRSTTISTTTS